MLLPSSEGVNINQSPLIANYITEPPQHNKLSGDPEMLSQTAGCN